MLAQWIEGHGIVPKLVSKLADEFLQERPGGTWGARVDHFGGDFYASFLRCGAWSAEYSIVETFLYFSVAL